MSLDVAVVLGAFIVGIAVGLTGMGGGALMTPVLVILFRVQPLAAVSSDLVASFLMKPFGGAIHLRRGTVHWDLVGWLCLGSVPLAFLGALLLHVLGTGRGIQNLIQVLLGLTLLIAAAALAIREVLIRRRRQDDELGDLDRSAIRPRRLATVAVGALGGLIVGVTSVGSGTLIVVLLLWLYPAMRTRDIVGTDLVQAIPLVGSAALGHLLFGNVQLGLTSSLVIGSVPGVILGAQISSRAGGRVIRPVLALVLLASGLKLLAVGTATLGVVVLGAALLVLGSAAVGRARALSAAVASRAS
ncbi:MAG TPA: sulfite exporter TauE/SafE family protein [Candidatus Dormibacteraeota bacterium]|jgi:hypothetical protein|nr:sulfite exporter TauE/SafE family protein [Candidatus Dormibacteraeota bacterium]